MYTGLGWRAIARNASHGSFTAHWSNCGLISISGCKYCYVFDRLKIFL
jgi:hypothetical protein